MPLDAIDVMKGPREWKAAVGSLRVGAGRLCAVCRKACLSLLWAGPVAGGMGEEIVLIWRLRGRWGDWPVTLRRVNRGCIHTGVYM